jgi:hypothetical protein
MQYSWGHKCQEVVLNTWATVSGKVRQSRVQLIRQMLLISVINSSY